jgi:hypothetical protein
MKKIYLILLSVIMLSAVGCNSSGSAEAETEIKVSDKYSVKADEPVEKVSTQALQEETKATQEASETALEQQENKTTADEINATEESVTNKNDNADDVTVETQTQEISQNEDNSVVESQSQVSVVETKTEEKTEQAQVQQSVEYSPDSVVAKAIAKCQAGGMITTQDNLAKNLAAGKITQAEYNAYYPYDGLENSYYSVFVETDLNKASDISGQPLRSEDAIATYIADMLLLENNPVFNIVYSGVYSLNGTDFYEFRCLR